MTATLETFDYSYPKHLIAQHPLSERDASRLMVLDRTRKKWEHRKMKEFPDFLLAGDLLIFNDTKVFPARLIGRDGAGRILEILLLEAYGSCSSNPVNLPEGAIKQGFRVTHTPFSNNDLKIRFSCLCKPMRKINVGTKIIFAPHWSGTIVTKIEDSIEIEFPEENLTTAQVMRDVYNSEFSVQFTGLPPATKSAKTRILNSKQVVMPLSMGKDSLATFALCQELGFKVQPKINMMFRNHG